MNVGTLQPNSTEAQQKNIPAAHVTHSSTSPSINRADSTLTAVPLRVGRRDSFTSKRQKEKGGRLTSLTLCVMAQVRKTRERTWKPVSTTDDGTIPAKSDKRERARGMGWASAHAHRLKTEQKSCALIVESESAWKCRHVLSRRQQRAFVLSRARLQGVSVIFH